MRLWNRAGSSGRAAGRIRTWGRKRRRPTGWREVSQSFGLVAQNGREAMITFTLTVNRKASEDERLRCNMEMLRCNTLIFVDRFERTCIHADRNLSSEPRPMHEKNRRSAILEAMAGRAVVRCANLCGSPAPPAPRFGAISQGWKRRGWCGACMRHLGSRCATSHDARRADLQTRSASRTRSASGPSPPPPPNSARTAIRSSSQRRHDLLCDGGFPARAQAPHHHQLLPHREALIAVSDTPHHAAGGEIYREQGHRAVAFRGRCHPASARHNHVWARRR